MPLESSIHCNYSEKLTFAHRPQAPSHILSKAMRPWAHILFLTQCDYSLFAYIVGRSTSSGFLRCVKVLETFGLTSTLNTLRSYLCNVSYTEIVKWNVAHCPHSHSLHVAPWVLLFSDTRSMRGAWIVSWIKFQYVDLLGSCGSRCLSSHQYVRPAKIATELAIIWLIAFKFFHILISESVACVWNSDMFAICYTCMVFSRLQFLESQYLEPGLKRLEFVELGDFKCFSWHSLSIYNGQTWWWWTVGVHERWTHQLSFKRKGSHAKKNSSKQNVTTERANKSSYKCKRWAWWRKLGGDGMHAWSVGGNMTRAIRQK